MARRRILESIRLDKIAVVDRPCQEGARVTIMKRAQPSVDMEKLVERLTKALMQDAWDDAQNWQAWCACEKGLEPMVGTLKRAVASGSDIRKSVSQFLQQIEQSYPEALPVVENGVVSKALQRIRKSLLVVKTGMAALGVIDARNNVRKARSSRGRVSRPRAPTVSRPEPTTRRWGWRSSGTDNTQRVGDSQRGVGDQLRVPRRRAAAGGVPRVPRH